MNDEFKSSLLSEDGGFIFIDKLRLLWICNSLNIVHESVTIVC